MLQFQPTGFVQQVIETSLGILAYYTPNDSPWHLADEARILPPLIFLHSLGGGSSAYEWSKVYPAFASSHCVIAPDLIGWGHSTHPPRDYQIEDYLTIIAEVIQRTTESPAIVVASSLTAGITIRLAIQRPELFSQLLLVNPSGYGDFGTDYSQRITAQLAGIPGLDRLIYAVGAANEVAVRNFLQQFLFADGDRITDEMVKAYTASARQFNAEYAALASLKGNLCFDLALYIQQLNVPTVFLWGERARFSPLSVGQRLASLNPSAVKAFHTIPNTGVLPHLEAPELVIGDLQRYI
jgi:pimeloyl-ACP methyl ester carboxylesterase